MPLLHYSSALSLIGYTLLAYTSRGIGLVLLGDDEVELQRLLKTYYPASQMIEDDYHQSVSHQMLLDWIEHPHPRLDVPLDMAGTAFQRRVWLALCDIPLGETRSYQSIACSLGMPRACRAVAGACAANRLALFIPCHRVIRSDGSLSGYRWGTARKRLLLEREAEVSNESLDGRSVALRHLTGFST